MKQKVMRIVCLTMVLVLSLSFTAYANEGDDHYNTYNDHILVSGIGSVTCSNRVDRALHTDLYNAVEIAIRDWDWHLGLLNTEYGVDWNMTSIGADAEANISICEAVPEMVVSGRYAYTSFYGYSESEGLERLGNDLDPEQSNWESVIIWAQIDEMDNEDCLTDLSFLRKVINHELGHALGLAHYSGDVGVLMYNYAEDATADVPTRAELMGIYHLYG